MTEKRFVETVSTGIVTDNMTNKEYNCEMRIDDDFLHLINNIADENEQLKEALIELREIGDYQYERIKELFDENEQLESEVAYYKLMLESLQQYAREFVEKHNKKGYK